MKRKSALVITILLLAIGFAAISTTLIINGNTKVNENIDDYSVIFTYAYLDDVDVYDEVISQDKKTITFKSKDLKKINDASTLNYEVTNNSSNYDAEVSVTCVPKDGTTAKYTSIKNELENNVSIVKAKESVNGTLMINLTQPSTEEVIEEYTCKLEFNAVERTELGKYISAFQRDSWETIVANVKKGFTRKYNIGDTKTITVASHTNDCSISTGRGSSYKCESSLESEKELIVRLANKSECTTETSETACGFVVEFVDIIENHIYNKASSRYEWGTNVGGWKNSELRAYINGVLYNSLSKDLQNVIISTKVISGHGSTSGETNFETEDKLYLLSSEEIYGDFKSSSNLKYDTAAGTSKQLDYYKNQNVTEENYEKAIKHYNGVDSDWWLRSASSDSGYNFMRIENGFISHRFASRYPGISPAFRIG